MKDISKVLTEESIGSVVLILVISGACLFSIRFAMKTQKTREQEAIIIQTTTSLDVDENSFEEAYIGNATGAVRNLNSIN